MYSLTTPASHTSTLMAFISQHCRTPELLLKLFDVKVDISLYFEKDWDNLNDDVTDFLFAAAEHTKAPPVGLHDSDTILKNTTNSPNQYTLAKCFGAKKDSKNSKERAIFHLSRHGSDLKIALRASSLPLVRLVLMSQ